MSYGWWCHQLWGYFRMQKRSREMLVKVLPQITALQMQVGA